MHLEPIGYFYSSYQDKYDAPRQSGLVPHSQGLIQLNPHCQFEQALEGLEGFDRIWVVFWFHLNPHWKPKVLPPRSDKKRGVFATRSPHRPNRLGLSCVELKSVKGLNLYISNHDLLDGTPILDIKPYINEVDAIPAHRQGWLEEIESKHPFVINWQPLAQTQANYLKEHGSVDIDKIHTRLVFNPFPNPHNRIQKIKENHYKLAYKSWRIFYYVQDQNVEVQEISSGYDAETLQGKKQSKWEDVSLHMAFMRHFYPSI